MKASEHYKEYVPIKNATLENIEGSIFTEEELFDFAESFAKTELMKALTRLFDKDYAEQYINQFIKEQ